MSSVSAWHNRLIEPLISASPVLRRAGRPTPGALEKALGEALAHLDATPVPPTVLLQVAMEVLLQFPFPLPASVAQPDRRGNSFLGLKT